MNIIYLDNQATTPLDPDVLEVMSPYSEGLLFANPHSSEHLLGIQAAQQIDEARGKVADYLNALLSEVIFTSGATESNNMAIIGTAIRANQNNSIKNKILVSSIEHKCVLGASRFVADTFGFEVLEIPVTSEGILNLDTFESMLDDNVLQVCVMGTNNEIGTNQPIKEVSQLCEPFNISLHVDASQSCYLDLDPDLLGITTMSISSHKIYGPKGIGCLFINENIDTVKPFPIFHGGGQENGMRSGTLPTPLIVGFGVASEKMADIRDDEAKSLKDLSDFFVSELSKTNIDFNINGCTSNRHPANLNIEFIGKDATTLLGQLNGKICASTGSACTSGIHEPSHVLKAIGLSTQRCDSSIRISFGRFNTKENIIEAVNIIKSIYT